MSTNRSPLKAIRAKCIDCCCGNKTEVRLCSSEKCPLWAFRSGHRLPKEIVEGEGGDEKTLNNSGFSGQSGDSGEEDAD